MGKESFDPKDWVTAEEFSRALGISSSTLNQCACLGLFPKPDHRPDGLEVWPRKMMQPLLDDVANRLKDT